MSEGAALDLIVIGGGINGAGIARDAAGRGARVLLLEAGDLAGGTSSASTKLIHGGLRYLEHGEFALVREALREREVLWTIAPHLIRPLRFVLPWVPQLRPRWMLRLGLLLYDHIGGRKLLPAADTIRLHRHPAGMALRPECDWGFEYSDCRADDSRLVVLNALDAHERGAQIRTRTPVVAARREGALWAVETPAGTFHGRALVNAGGPGADEVAALAGERLRLALRRVRGSHIVVRRLFDHGYAYIFQLPDGRICFAIPFEDDFTLIGTTDRDHGGSLADVRPEKDEIAYLCAAASRYFVRPVAPADVVWSFAGVRALVDDGSGRPEAATRGYRLVLSDPVRGAPLLSVLGGKITSYRQLAERALARLADRLPVLGGAPWTARAPLPGGDFPAGALGEVVAALRAEYPFLSEPQARRIACAYGTRAADWLGTARSRQDLGRDFGAGLSEAELDHLRRSEWACCAGDALWRRSKLGLRLDEAQQAAVEAWFAAQ